MPSTDPVSWAFLVDEDMPRSMVWALRTAGYHADDVREVGLTSHPDTAIYAYAQTHQQTIVTADMGFANILQFPLGTHAGIVVTRFPNAIPTVQVNRELLKGLAALAGQSLAGILVIIELGRIRVRRLS